jgi:glycosyltransferase involved in cell wall biosynthesis
VQIKFEQVCREIPLDLVGIQSESLVGLGEIEHDWLHTLAAKYRFFFNPIRYSSLGLAVCEAMMVGLPVVGLATTGMVTAVKNGVTGYVSTDITWVIKRMNDLLAYPELAKVAGENAQCYAREHFCIERFRREWDETLMTVTG